MCTSCQSSFITYLSTIGVNFQCTPDPNGSQNKNIELLQYINSDTILGDSYLKSYTVDGSTQTSSTLLANGLCDFSS